MPVLLALEPANVEVEPGSAVSVKVRVRNQSERVDGFRLSVVGPAAAWSRVEPNEVQLFPRTDGEVQVTFAPPRASTPRAGAYPFGVLARSIADPSTTSVEEGDVTVKPFVALTSDLVRRVVRGWRSGGHVVNVTNTGNTTATMTVRASDPEEELTLTPPTGSVRLEPEGQARPRIGVSVNRALWRGANRRLPYTIEVSEPAAGSTTLSAVFEQRPIVPGWALILAGLLAALIVAAALGVFRDGGGASQSPGGPTSTPAATPTAPVGTPTGAPTPTLPPETPVVTLVPTPTPPTASTITISGHPTLSRDYLSHDDRGLILVDEGDQVVVISSYEVFGETCDLSISMRWDIGLGEYLLNDDAFANFVCTGLIERMTSTTGTLTIWERTAPPGEDGFITGAFTFDAVGEFGTSFTISGGFKSVFLVRTVS